jgi:hypothetical protein
MDNIQAITDALKMVDGKWNTLWDILGDEWFNYSEKDSPTMADSIGSLSDKLATVNFKMAYNQEILYKTRRQTQEEFCKTWENDLSKLHEVLKRCTDLNVQRSRLVDEIDRKLAAIVKGDINPDDLVNNQHKTY